MIVLFLDLERLHNFLAEHHMNFNESDLCHKRANSVEVFLITSFTLKVHVEVEQYTSVPKGFHIQLLN